MVNKRNKMVKNKGKRKHKVVDSNIDNDDSGFGHSTPLETSALSDRESALTPAKKKKKLMNNDNSGNKRKSKNAQVSSSSDDEEIVIETSGDENESAKLSSSNNAMAPKRIQKSKNVHASSSSDDEEIIIGNSSDDGSAEPSTSRKETVPRQLPVDKEYLYQKQLCVKGECIILEPPAFKFIKPKSGKPKLYIFDSADPRLCYKFTRVQDGSSRYECLGCFAKARNTNGRSKDDKRFYVTLSKNINGEYYIRMGHERTHCCEPIAYDEAEESPKEPKMYDCYEFFYYRKRQFPNSLNLAIYHPFHKNYCYLFFYLKSLKYYQCSGCQKLKKKITVHRREHENSDNGAATFESYFVQDFSKHVCQPFSASFLRRSDEYIILGKDGPKYEIEIAEKKKNSSGNEITDGNGFELQRRGDLDNGTLILHTDPENKNFFYEYVYKPSTKTYNCYNCLKAYKLYVTAKLLTNKASGEMVLSLGKNQHRCAPQFKSQIHVAENDDSGSVENTSNVASSSHDRRISVVEVNKAVPSNLKRADVLDDENDKLDDEPLVPNKSKRNNSTSMDTVFDENDSSGLIAEITTHKKSSHKKATSDISMDDASINVNAIEPKKSKNKKNNALEEDGPSIHSKTTHSVEMESTSIYHFEKPSISKLEEICDLFNIEYRNKAAKLWDTIIFDQIDTVAMTSNMQTHFFETDNFYRILSIFFTGKSKQHETIKTTIIDAFREKLVSSGEMATTTFNKRYLGTVTDEHFAFIAKYLSCRILILNSENGNKKYGNWKSTTSSRLTMVVALIDGCYVIVLSL